VLEHLGEPGGVLIVDETGFLKKGDRSAGVQRQYSGTAGRIENCQIGVFLAYASRKGHAFVDRVLYFPRAWGDDRARCRTAGIPDAVPFRTKPVLARGMLKRALDAGVRPAWVTADEVYGSDHQLRVLLEDRDQPYVLAVRRTEALVHLGVRGTPRAAALADALPRRAWRVLSAGAGTKGPRAFRWAWAEVRRPDEDAASRAWRHALLVRESLTPTTAGERERAYYVVFAPAAATLAEVVRVAGARWRIEQAFEAAKQEVGLDEYEVRKYDGWYRYVTLALFAHAFLAVARARAAPRKRGARHGPRTPTRSSR
jgi:SRSO17 transposase